MCVCVACVRACCVRACVRVCVCVCVCEWVVKEAHYSAHLLIELSAGYTTDPRAVLLLLFCCITLSAKSNSVLTFTFTALIFQKSDFALCVIKYLYEFFNSNILHLCALDKRRHVQY